MTQDTSKRLIASLQKPELYSHPAAGFEVFETHISLVLVAGDYAYKIKKPLDLGFLNFTDLKKRRFYCEEEIRINKPLAGGLYEKVIPITGSLEAPVLGGKGAPFEYAIQMKAFSQDQQWDRMLLEGRLEPEHLDALALKVADFHQNAARAKPEDSLGGPDVLWHFMGATLKALEDLIREPETKRLFEEIQIRTRRTFERLRSRLSERKAQGFVREC